MLSLKVGDKVRVKREFSPVFGDKVGLVVYCVDKASSFVKFKGQATRYRFSNSELVKIVHRIKNNVV